MVADRFIGKMIQALLKIQEDKKETFVCGMFYTAKKERGKWRLYSYAFTSVTQGKIEDAWKRRLPVKEFPVSGYRARTKKVRKGGAKE